MSGEKVLIIDDEKELCEIIRDYLKNEGCNVEICFNGEEGEKLFKSFEPQIVILDIMLPKIDGMELCRRIRAVSHVPILMMSARSSDIDKILGLGLGADDYVVKPFNMAELIARVKAQLRRYTKFSEPVDFQEASLTNKVNEVSAKSFGRLRINYDSYEVFFGEKLVQLAAKEFEVLAFLSQNSEKVFSREQIFNQVWGFNEYGDINTVTVHIRKIREKLELAGANMDFIKTVWGVGYKFSSKVL